MTQPMTQTTLAWILMSLKMMWAKLRCPPPPPLSTDAIAWLTHNELHNNAEFIKYVNLVNVLLRTNTSANCASFFFFFFTLFCTHSLTNTASAPSLPSTLPPPKLLGIASSRTAHHDCLPYPQPLQRPSEFPVSILWTLSDCKKDPKVGVSASNWSHPPMQRSIRYEDGTIISESDWKSIHKATIHIARVHLVSLDSSDRQAQRRKKGFLKHQFPMQWDNAMRELEKMAPLLSLCARSWKADMVLRAVLADKRISEPLPSPAASHFAPSSRSATRSVPALPYSAPCHAPCCGFLRSHPRDESHTSTPSGTPTSQSSQRLPPTSSTSQQPPSPSVRKAVSSKATSSKAKCKHEPSPTLRDGKKVKSTEDTVSSGVKSGKVQISFILLNS
jgi:hypothetical protein